MLPMAYGAARFMPILAHTRMRCAMLGALLLRALILRDGAIRAKRRYCAYYARDDIIAA